VTPEEPYRLRDKSGVDLVARITMNVSMLKRLWQRMVERHRRFKAELDQVVLEMAKEHALKPPRLLFPKRPYKASTIALFCVFGFFVAFAAWACFKELVIAFFR